MCADTSVSVLSRTRGFISYYIYYNVDICLEVYVLANIKSGVKTAVKKVEAAVAAGDKENAQKELLNATSLIDKAEKKGVFHKNTASNKVSRLAKLVNTVQ